MLSRDYSSVVAPCARLVPQGEVIKWPQYESGLFRSALLDDQQTERSGNQRPPTAAVGWCGAELGGGHEDSVIVGLSPMLREPGAVVSVCTTL